MRYSSDFTKNEDIKTLNGEREHVTYPMLKEFLGSDNYSDKVEEMLLDMLNNQYTAYDATNDIRNHYVEVIEG